MGMAQSYEQMQKDREKRKLSGQNNFKVNMNQQINYTTVNPAYVQINKREAANILAMSERELDRRRKTDPRCPPGFKEHTGRTSPVKFRLSDIYTYSEAIMADAMSATG